VVPPPGSRAVAALDRGWSGTSETLVLVLTGQVEQDDVPRLCARACELLAGSIATEVVCDVRDLQEPSLTTVETLARLQLAVRQRGLRVTLRDPSERLLELLRFIGLEQALPACASVVDAKRKPEQREEPLGVEKEADPRDGSIR
jgi:ABC-type transporter Mla MlaB component